MLKLILLGFSDEFTKRVDQIFERVFGPEPGVARTGKTAAAG